MQFIGFYVSAVIFFRRLTDCAHTQKHSLAPTHTHTLQTQIYILLHASHFTRLALAQHKVIRMSSDSIIEYLTSFYRFLFSLSMPFVRLFLDFVNTLHKVITVRQV